MSLQAGDRSRNLGMNKYKDVLLFLLIFWCLFSMYLMGTMTWVRLEWAAAVVIVVTVLETFCVIGLCDAWKDKK